MKRRIEEEIGNIYENEHIKRIKYNKAVWTNNIKVGCSKPADYNKLDNRTYIEFFPGKISGKGSDVIHSNYLTAFEHYWNDTTYNYMATLQQQDENNIW